MRIAINGFGRIGRTFFRAGVGDYGRNKGGPLKIVAANDLGERGQLKHLLEYDSTYGRAREEVMSHFSTLKLLAESEPEKLPWKELGIDLVIESTGRFTEKDKASQHLRAGAKKVIISAPSKDADIMLIPGVNLDGYSPENHKIISMGSCTTNCLAPLVKVLKDNFGLKRGLMTTTHAYTADQNLQDGPHHDDLRRSRAAAENIIPTTTGAAKAIFKAVEGLEGKMDGIALRVPIKTVSILDLVCEVREATNVEKVNKIFHDYAGGEMKGILEVSSQQLVSSDFIANPHSAIVDAPLTQIIGGSLVKVVAWYDNEWGYSCRLVDLVKFLEEKGI